MVMALSETSRNVENEKTGMTHQHSKHSGKSKQQTSNSKLNPWKTFFKKSNANTTLRRNDDITRNEKEMAEDKNDTNKTNAITRSSSVVIGNSRTNTYDEKNNKNQNIYDHHTTSKHHETLNHERNNEKIMPPSISLYHI